MGCKTENTTFGENEYSVTQWPAEKSILMKMKLMRVLGPALVELAQINDANDSEQFSIIAKAINSMFATNQPEEVTALLKQCVVGVGLNGKILTDSQFDPHFSGDNLLECYKVFTFVIRVNYSDLFPGQLANNLLAKMKAKVQAEAEEDQ